MTEKFEYIVLPPDGFHLTLRDRWVDAMNSFRESLEAVSCVKRREDRYIVKYRTEAQRMRFPCNVESRVGYGALLSFCTEQTSVIGFPNSAMVECLLNDIRFFSFWDYSRYQLTKYTSSEATSRLLKIVHVARSKEELIDHLTHQKIYKNGHSKNDLLHKEGIRLHEIVSKILGS